MELTATAARADSLAGVGDESARVRNAMLAAGFHRRLRDGDFQVGDRIVVTIVSDAVHRDTAVVRPGGLLELPGNIVVPIHGVLRSELHDRVATEVLKLVKASEIQVTALMRVGVLGEVARPGYFAFAPDIPITDAIMGAGGPTAAADLARTTVRRGNQAYRSSDETRKAIAGGLTLDEFGLNAGDELVIGQRSSGGASTILGFLGAFGSVAAVYVALHRR
ncbi:MAG TPA: SLBB domain-containing protein [Gemmatimonadaceae bacterium]|jgi:protein involved in polysaccharide export with SLBB domain|nr:SLBB domain-containing protein [Gemmatimonadaceae bacterium]